MTLRCLYNVLGKDHLTSVVTESGLPYPLEASSLLFAAVRPPDGDEIDSVESVDLSISFLPFAKVSGD